MIINPKRIILSLCFLVGLLAAQAQENNCVTFEEFDEEQNFGQRNGDEPGSLAFTQGDVKVTLEPFQYFNGSTDFWNATVYETLFSDFELAEGKSLFVSNINLHFDFTALEKPVRRICMAYFDGGGEENISVNGSPIFVLNHLGEAPQEIAPGVRLSIEPPVGDNQFLSTGMLCLEGDIKTLLIGGQEFGLDNICWDTCPIYNLSAGISGCQQHPNLYYQYDIQLNFLYEGSSEAGFDLWQNQEFIGYYEYSVLPLTLPDVPNTQGLDSFVYTICENDNEGCCREIEVPLAPCEEICQLEARVEEVGCNEAGTEYIALVAIDGQNISDTLRVSNSQGLSYLVVKDPSTQLIEVGFEPLANSVDLVMICDYEDPSCCYSLWIQYPCAPSDECQFSDFEATILDCYETNAGIAYDVKINFVANGTSNDFFDLYGREGLIDFFRFDQLPITLSGYVPEGNPDNLWFKVTENDNPDCQAVTEVATGECQAANCVIENVTVWEMDCNASGTEYLALISIEGEGLSHKFKATNSAGESFYYEYPPSGSEVQIGFSTNPSGRDVIVICDYASPDCCKTIEVEYPCQPNGSNCEIRDLEVDILACELTSAGYAYDLKINFVSEGTNNSFFDLFLQGELYETYSFEQRPITVSNYLPGPGNNSLSIKVAENDNLECHSIVEIPLAPCDNTGECHISEVIAEAHNCDGNTFLLDVAFQSANPGALGYYVYGDGAIFGPYSYDEAFVTIGPFPGDGQNIVDILILDIANPACFGYLEFGPLDCETQCRISEVVAEQLDCVDGSYYVQVDFESENTGEEGFTIRGNGTNYGSFSYEDAPVMVGPITSTDNQLLEFVVIDNADPSCRAFTTLEPTYCPNCQIENLSYTVACAEASTYFTLELDFEVTEPSSGSFYLLFDGEIYEGFAYESLPLVLDLPLDLAAASTIAVVDKENPNCGQTIDFSVPCCSLRDLVVEAHPCEEDGSFLLDLNLLHTNTQDSFTVVYGPANGDLSSAQYAYEDLYLTLRPLNGLDQTDWYFQVTDESLFCSTSGEFTFESCELAACLGFEEAQAGSYGPITGYEAGDIFLQEGGLSFGIGSSCDCFVHIVEYPSIFPAFSLAQGQMMVLDGSEVVVGFEDLDSTVEELTIDYYFDGNQFSLVVNDATLIQVGHPTELPNMVAPGITLTVSPAADDPKMGTLTFTGNVNLLLLGVEGKMSLDNVCLTLGTEEVWPGDINTDNIANHFDLLPLGIAQGVEGPIRENESTNWQGIPAAPWELSFPNGVNYKHADTDGNGRIEPVDRQAILDNFLETRGTVIPFEPVAATPNNPSLFVETPNEGWPVGQAFNLPIVLGTPTLPVEGIHGIAFTIEFDPEAIRPESIALDFSNSWLGDVNQDLLTLDKTLAEEGQIFVALSRVGPQELLGSGPVASLIGIIDDIAGLSSTPINVTAPLAVTATLDTIPIFTESSDLIIQRFQDVPKLDLLKSLILSPNPTNDEVRIWNKFGVAIDQVDVMDSAGNLLSTIKEGANRISLKAQPAGVYMLRIRMGQVIAHRRIVRL